MCVEPKKHIRLGCTSVFTSAYPLGTSRNDFSSAAVNLQFAAQPIQIDARGPSLPVQGRTGFKVFGKVKPFESVRGS